MSLIWLIIWIKLECKLKANWWKIIPLYIICFLANLNKHISANTLSAACSVFHTLSSWFLCFPSLSTVKYSSHTFGTAGRKRRMTKTWQLLRMEHRPPHKHPILPEREADRKRIINTVRAFNDHEVCSICLQFLDCRVSETWADAYCTKTWQELLKRQAIISLSGFTQFPGVGKHRFIPFHQGTKSCLRVPNAEMNASVQEIGFGKIWHNPILTK